MGKSPTVWMRALRAHTYMGRPQDNGDVYLAHEEQVENIINLKFAVRDNPPETAVREAVRPSVPAESLAPPEMAGVARVARVAPIPAKVDNPDPNMAPWPTPSATNEKARRKPRGRGRTTEDIMRAGQPKVVDTPAPKAED